MLLIAEDEGPTKVNPLDSSAAAKSALSDKKP